MDELTRAFRDSVFLEKRQMTRSINEKRDDFENETFDMRLVSLALDNSPADHNLSDRLDRIIFVRKCLVEETCSICLSSVKNKKAKITPCGHYYHSQCLSRWTNDKKQRSCPACRDDLFPLDPARNRRPNIEEEEFTLPQLSDASGNLVEESSNTSLDTVYPSDGDSIPSDEFDVPVPWDLDTNSPILMLPEHPHPSRCLSLLDKVSSNDFVLPVTEEQHNELFYSMFRNTHLPTSWRRRTYEYVHSFEEQWTIWDASKLEWGEGRITLQTEGNMACADSVSEYLHQNRIWTKPEVLVRQRDQEPIIDILEVWVPELIGGLPSRRGGIVLDDPRGYVSSISYNPAILRPSFYQGSTLPMHWPEVKLEIVGEAHRYATDILNSACELMACNLPITPSLWSGY